jgi:hypothetical protein
MFHYEGQARVAALERRYAHQLANTPQWLGIAVGSGWLSVVEALLAAVDRELSPFELRRFQWVQIKEKWGGLRAYYDLDGQPAALHADVMSLDGVTHLVVHEKRDPLAEKLHALVTAAVTQAARTCELCGSEEQVLLCAHGGHVQTLCAGDRDRLLATVLRRTFQ